MPVLRRNESAIHIIPVMAWSQFSVSIRQDLRHDLEAPSAYSSFDKPWGLGRLIWLIEGTWGPRKVDNRLLSTSTCHLAIIKAKSSEIPLQIALGMVLTSLFFVVTFPISIVQFESIEQIRKTRWFHHSNNVRYGHWGSSDLIVSCLICLRATRSVFPGSGVLYL